MQLPVDVLMAASLSSFPGDYMNDKALKLISVVIGIFLSASLLSGAGVGFSSWYPAPSGISVLLVSITCSVCIVRFLYFLIKLFFGNSHIRN